MFGASLMDFYYHVIPKRVQTPHHTSLFVETCSSWFYTLCLIITVSDWVYSFWFFMSSLSLFCSFTEQNFGQIWLSKLGLIKLTHLKYFNFLNSFLCLYTSSLSVVFPCWRFRSPAAVLPLRTPLPLQDWTGLQCPFKRAWANITDTPVDCLPVIWNLRHETIFHNLILIAEFLTRFEVFHSVVSVLVTVL